MDRKNELLLRVYIILISFIVFAGVISWKMIDISIVKGDKWKAKNASKFLKWKPMKAQRGDIYSEDGIRMMVSSIEFFEIRMDPVSSSDEVFSSNIYQLCVGLSKILSTKTANEWRNTIEGARNAYNNSQKKGTRNILIAKKIDDEKFRALKELPLFNLGQHEGGFIVNRFFSRKKPYHELASRTIGLYREKNMVGLERSYDKALRGSTKKELMRFIPPDLWIPMKEPTSYEFKRGKDLITSIDVDIQDVVHHELTNGMTENNAKDGVVIVMEVKTGYIKAISNLNFHNGEINEIMNKAVVERIEPGSTFKAATALALLEKGISPEKKVKINKGKKKFHNLWMYDSNYPSDVNITDFKESFSKSSNVGIATLANEVFNSKKGKK
ncbi:MAG: penicillin-binding transpeptidase domain-containing protein, partial [Saprospiraceae bacterium]